MKHLYRFKGVLQQIFTDQRNFRNYIWRRGDYMAATFVCLHDIEQLARTCPQKSRPRQILEQRGRFSHQWHRVNACIGDAASEDRNDDPRRGVRSVRHNLHLIKRQDGGDVERKPFLG